MLFRHEKEEWMLNCVECDYCQLPMVFWLHELEVKVFLTHCGNLKRGLFSAIAHNFLFSIAHKFLSAIANNLLFSIANNLLFSIAHNFLSPLAHNRKHWEEIGWPIFNAFLFPSFTILQFLQNRELVLKTFTSTAIESNWKRVSLLRNENPIEKGCHC